MSLPVSILEEEITVWRLVPEKYKADAFSGEGARRYGGRWNSKGESVVYTASSRALAILEMLVQAARLPAYISIPAVLPRGLKLAELELKTLPDNWNQMPAPDEVRALGSAWFESRSSCALKVPSAVVPVEHNYILNPEHPDFSLIRIGSGESMALDPRLLDYSL